MLPTGIHWVACFTPLKASLHNTLGGSIRLAIILATIPVLIRLIGVEEYGVYAVVSAVMGVVVLAEGGLTVSTTVFASRDLAQRDSAALGQTLAITLFTMTVLATTAATVLLFCAGPVSECFVKLQPAERTTVTVALRFSAVAVWARLLQQVFTGIEQACQRYGILNTINTAVQVLANIGMLGVATLGGRSVALMQWLAFVSVLSLLLHVIVVWRLIHPWRPQLGWDSQRARAIGRYSLLTWTSSLGTVLFSQCDRLIIGALLGSGPVGVYAAITSVTGQINVVSALPTQPLLPLVSHCAATGALEAADLRSRMREALQASALISLGLGMGLSLFAAEAVRIILPEAGPEVPGLFRLAAIIYSVYSLNSAGYMVMLGVGRLALCTWIVLLSGVFTLLLIAVGTSCGGLAGGIAGNMGYATTLILLPAGMQCLKIPAWQWLGWLRTPLLWFCVLLPANLLAPATLAWRIPLYLAEIGALVGWWAKHHRESLWLLLGRKP